MHAVLHPNSRITNVPRRYRPDLLSSAVVSSLPSLGRLLQYLFTTNVKKIYLARLQSFYTPPHLPPHSWYMELAVTVSASCQPCQCGHVNSSIHLLLVRLRCLPSQSTATRIGTVASKSICMSSAPSSHKRIRYRISSTRDVIEVAGTFFHGGQDGSQIPAHQFYLRAKASSEEASLKWPRCAESTHITGLMTF